VFGQGLDENIRLAYGRLIENDNEGDEIFIFGFSRGAFTARSRGTGCRKYRRYQLPRSIISRRDCASSRMAITLSP
jgi:uncharacterized protein (DUF2235 family)